MKSSILLLQKIMKVLLIANIIVISTTQFLLADVVFGQLLNKRVDLYYSKASAFNIIEDMQRKTKIDFAFADNLGLKQIIYTNIRFENLTLGDALQRLFASKGIAFTEKSGMITLHKSQQTGTVYGKVTDQEGQPLTGAGVKIVELNRAVSTDKDGNYSLKVLPGSYSLEVSYVSFQTQRRSIEIIENQSISVNFSMESAADLLNELVVVGYGTQRKSDVTSSISKISGKEIENAAVSNVAMAIQGRASGVEVMNSGTPGKTPNIRIRGMGSINATDPLVVLDGVPVEINIFMQLSPAEIQSVEILKDAVSGAIYGTRAANGVILVTTKSGRYNQKASIRLNASGGVNSVIKRYPVLDAEQLYTLKRESFEINKVPIPASSPWAIPYYNTTRTDWQDEFFRNGLYQDYNLNMSAGSEKSAINANLYYRDEQGTQINTNFGRLGFSLKATQQVNKRLRFEGSLRANKNNDLLNYDAQASSGTLFAAYFFHPSIPVRYGNGDFGSSIDSAPFSEGDWGSGRAHNDLGDMWNPIYKSTEEWYKTASFNTLVNLKGDLDLAKGLVLTGRAAYSYQNSESEIFNKPTPLQSRTIANPVLTKGMNINNFWLGELFATYKQNFGNHNVVANIGTTAQVFGGSVQRMRGEGFASLKESHLVLNNANVLTGSGSPINSTALASFFARTNYSFGEKYYFSATLRADGSSRFAEGNRWGYFPAFSTGWRISAEPFMKDLPMISNLKLNIGWGTLGNQNVTPFQYLDIFVKDQRYILGGRNVTGTRPEAFANPDISWEASETTNILLELGMFKQRLNIEAAYFDKRTKDMLVPTIRQFTMGGIRIPDSNIGDIRNHGVELEISTQQPIGDKGSWSVGANASFIKNKLVKLNGTGSFLGDGPARSYEGGSLSTFYGWKTDGIYQTQAEIDADPNIARDSRKPNILPGDVRFVDINGDGAIGDEDRTNIGNPNPTMSYGFFMNLNYGAFDFAANFSGRAGYDVYDAIMLRNIQANGKFNMHKNALERWTGPGTSNLWPRLSRVSPNENYRDSDLALSSADYLRLKDLVIGYTIPVARLKQIGMQNLRVFFAGRNLLTFTRANIVDPEENSGFSNLRRGVIYTEYPQSRAYSIGLDITF